MLAWTLALVGTVRDVAEVLVPKLAPRAGSRHLDSLREHYVGARSAFPQRQFVALSGDGGPAVTLGDLITPKRQRHPVKIVASRVKHPADLPDTLRAEFARPGPALVEVMTARQELSIPPTITFGQVKA